MGRPRSDKKQRLVTAASSRFHRDGIAATSIAEVARDAGVPVGNVYYYFRTKDDLVRAVVDEWDERIGAALSALDGGLHPLERLSAYLDSSARHAPDYAALGCPLVALARDLRQSGTPLAPLAKTVHARQIDWFRKQFEESGAPAFDASRRARSLLATLNGCFHLAHATGDPALLVETIAELKERMA